MNYNAVDGSSKLFSTIDPCKMHMLSTLKIERESLCMSISIGINACWEFVLSSYGCLTGAHTP